jgi:hypothetical protein
LKTGNDFLSLQIFLGLLTFFVTDVEPVEVIEEVFPLRILIE